MENDLVTFIRTQDTLKVQGELTRNSLIDEKKLKQYLENTQSALFFDLSEVSRVDTAGLAWLIHSLDLLKLQGTSLKLQNIPEQLQNLMALGQVSNLFE